MDFLHSHLTSTLLSIYGGTGKYRKPGIHKKLFGMLSDRTEVMWIIRFSTNMPACMLSLKQKEASHQWSHTF